ncbi:hypothetical protein K438DRAFT_1846853 [Mycena galopus ATCC 62051]|nr:hypothetical protein K438DRAFT_1846853 [Mycena galopus ATCC 62051]
MSYSALVSGHHTAHSKMNPMPIPAELLQDIAALIDPRDLSSFAQVDRFTYAVVAPYLFRCIELSLGSVHSLAAAFRSKPELAAACRSLSFRSGHSVVADHMDLIGVFRAISVHGRLEILRWRSYTSIPEDIWIPFFSVFSPLRELELYEPSTKKNFWDTLAQTCFAELQIFRIYLPSCHGWDGACIQALLDGLPHLEELALEFPRHCCGPRGLTLNSTHPHLKRFSFTSANLKDENDFLARHPGIESLFLDTDQTFRCTDLHNLRLNVDDPSLYLSPSLVDSDITHLRLRSLVEDVDPIVADVVRAARSTLRCLELDFDSDKSEAGPIPGYVIALLRAAPALDEVAVLCDTVSERANWSSNLLTELLTALGPATPVRAVRFECTQAVPQSRLDDLGPLPPHLKYIGWDAGSTSLIYVIERQGSKNLVAKILTRVPTDDWMTEGVLHFMGESWTAS